MEATRLPALVLIGLSLLLGGCAHRAQPWATSWAASAQGPYPVGNPTAEPDLAFALPDPATGAREQSFRLIVRPDRWGERARLRLSNAFGTRPVRFDAVTVALAQGGAAIAAGTMQKVTFAGAEAVTVAPGTASWSDPVGLPFVEAADDALLDGRKLAVSLHVAGASGPMTWHAKALQTSYLTAPGASGMSAAGGGDAFPYSTTSWYFLDALDMSAPAGTRVIVCLGDSITDGSGSTLNGDDRWPDALARRLHAAGGPPAVVVNEGIGGNQIVGPPEYKVSDPFDGGPSALARLDRDVLGLSGVTHVIWMEGINDLSGEGKATPAAVIEGLRRGVARLRAARPGLRILGATLTSALHSTSADHGSPEVDRKRRTVNEFIRHGGLFDGVVDFDAATLDPRTGELRPEFVPSSTLTSPGDRLHPNRAGYLAMARSVRLELLR